MKELRLEWHDGKVGDRNYNAGWWDGEPGIDRPYICNDKLRRFFSFPPRQRLAAIYIRLEKGPGRDVACAVLPPHETGGGARDSVDGEELPIGVLDETVGALGVRRSNKTRYFSVWYKEKVR